MANRWTTAENNAYAFLLDALTAEVDGETAFQNELPATFADETVDHIWHFSINGGGDPDDVGAGESTCGINCAGVIEGLFIERTDAQQFACDVKVLMPVAADDIEGIQDMRLEKEPSIMRVKYKREADQTNQSGEGRGWAVTIPLSCVIVGAGS
jgi:hypothetical protein